MKIIKNTSVILLIGFVFYIAFRKSDIIDLRGKWTPTKIVVDSINRLPLDDGTNFFNALNLIEIRGWQDSLHISTKDKYHASARIKLIKNQSGADTVLLTSKENALNGHFKIDLETVHIGPQSYRVYIKIFAKNTTLHFEREVNIPPWKPESPRKGQV